eukprot:11822222-Alexandrium_andersonii.AAC.1
MGIEPQVIPHVAQEVAPPLRQPAECPEAWGHRAGHAGGAWARGRLLEAQPRPRAAAGRGNPPLGRAPSE